MTDMIKCLKCGQVLISGRGAIAIFGKGTSISCNKCGNTYTFGEEKKHEPAIWPRKWISKEEALEIWPNKQDNSKDIIPLKQE